MLKNKTKILLLCSIVLITLIGISSISATDTNDTSIDTQQTTITDIPTTSNNNVENSIVKDVQTSDIDSNVKTKTKELTKKVEKEDNVKELKFNDNGWSFSLNYAPEIQSGSNLTVKYSIGLNEIIHSQLSIGLMYTDSSNVNRPLTQSRVNSWEDTTAPNGLTGSVDFPNLNPVNGAKSYYIHVNYNDDELGGLETNPNEYQFTFADVTPEPSNITVDSVTFATVDNKVFTNTDTNVTVVLSNTGSECDRADVKLTIDGINQTRTVTNLGSSPKSVVYTYNFATEGQKNVNVIVDYLNGTSFTAYTGNITVTAPTSENRPNITVNGVSYTKKQNKVLTETATNVTVAIGNEGTLTCNEANLILIIGDQNQTKTINNIAAGSTQNIVYEYIFKSPGTKTVQIMVDYLNGTTIEAYSGNVKVEIYYTTVSSELLTTKATGTVTGGLYHNAIQNPAFNSALYTKYQSDATFNFADTYSNITTARLYAVLYDSREEHPQYSFNLTMDGNNDGEYETIIENDHYIGLATTADSTVYKLNDNVTKVYTDYVLFYDVTNYINSNTVNVELNTSFGCIKCIGLIVAYNQENSGKKVDYWINLGTTWTNTEVSSTFATKNYEADDIKLIQSISSSSNPTTTFNGNQLTYTRNPSGYFGIESWNVTDKYSPSSNTILKNTASGSFKTMAATLELTTYSQPEVTVDSVTFTKTQDTVLSYFDTNVTVVVSNAGSELGEINVTLTVGDDSQTKTVSNVGSVPQSVVFEEYFTSTGDKNVSVVIDYLNGTQVTAYTGNVSVLASGYMGKSFTNGTNMTVRPVYEGYNTLNVFGHFFGYQSNRNASFTFDAAGAGLVDVDKVVDVLYYQPWGTWNGVNASVKLVVNDKNISLLSSYEDQKGFGSYNYPYGLNVYNITSDLVYGGVNNFTVIPVSASGYAYIYGGYIVAVYANNTNRTVISIAEDQDALSAGTSSSYGATNATAIAYANHDGIDVNGVSSAYVVATANNAANSDNNLLWVNDVNYGNLGTSYNSSSQVAIYTVDVTEDVAEDNVIAVQCIRDTSVYVLSSILVVTYEEQVPEVTVDSVVISTYGGSLLALENNTITINLTSNMDIDDPINVNLIIGDYETSQRINNISSGVNSVVFNDYYPAVAGNVDLSIVIDYLNDTTVTAYTSTMPVYYNGYMGKSFTNNSNMTNAAVYDGYNTVNVFVVSDYISANWNEKTFTFDAAANGITEDDKIVDVLYYVPYTYSKGLNFTTSVNNEIINIKSSYVDAKGFGTYNYPYGLIVYNLTGAFKANQDNTIILTPGESNNIGLYGTYLVIVYANATQRNNIIISEDCDMLSTTSSAYGATNLTAVSYANYDEVDLEELSGSQLIVIAGGSDNIVNVLLNEESLGSLGSTYNSTTQLSIFEADVYDIVSTDNALTIQSINDNLYTYNSILILNYGEPTREDYYMFEFDTIESVTVGENATITGTLNYYENTEVTPTPMAATEIIINIGEDTVSTTTDANGKFNVTYLTTKSGTFTVSGNFENDTEIKETSTVLNVTKKSQIIVESDTMNIDDNVTIKVSLVDDIGEISEGMVIIRINGKTLRDDDGNVIYVSVVNGEAVLPNVTVTNEWMKPDTSIQSFYIGREGTDFITTDPLPVNITKKEATIEITGDLEGKSNEEVTLSASVTDKNGNVNTGRVIFKLNGKTLKDNAGKIMYVDVVNGVASTTYTIPAKTKSKTYNLTAVFVDNNYERVEVMEDFIVS